MHLSEQMHAFLARRPESVGTAARSRLNASFRLWDRYYGFLQIIKTRYQAADAEFMESVRRQYDALQREVDANPGPRLETPEEHQESLRIAAICERLHLEIESFYVFAKVLVDRMADTAAFYFDASWRKAGSTHTQFTNRLEWLCRERGLRLAPPELPDTLHKVRNRIVKYRTDDIEHVSEPVAHATTFHLEDGKARIAPWVVSPVGGTAAGISGVKRCEVPDELFPLLDCYGAVLLQFFEANVDKSVSAIHS